MKISLLYFVFVVHFIVIFSVLITSAVELSSTISITENEKEKDPLVTSLNNIVTKIQSIKARLDKMQNETIASSELKKSRHDLLLDSGYQFTSGIGYHKLHITKLSWSDALHFCRNKKAHLAVINSSEEKLALGNLVKNSLSPIQDEETIAYVGIHDYCKSELWVTIFFDVLNNAKYINWKEGFPNYKGKSHVPNCAAIDINGQLINLECTKKQAFICEVEL